MIKKYVSADKKFVSEYGTMYKLNNLESSNLKINNIPVDGLLFYAPLSENKTVAETGQSLSINGTITYEEINGIPAALFNGSSYISMDTLITSDSQPYTLSCWFKKTSGSDSAAFNIGHNSTARRFCLFCTSEYKIQLERCNTTVGSEILGNDRMHHVLASYNGSGESKLYIDGVLVNSDSSTSISAANGDFIIGRFAGYGGYYWNGYISACRLYNRVLEDKEVVQLYKEFRIK